MSPRASQLVIKLSRARIFPQCWASLKPRKLSSRQTPPTNAASSPNATAANASSFFCFSRSSFGLGFISSRWLLTCASTPGNISVITHCLGSFVSTHTAFVIQVNSNLTPTGRTKYQDCLAYSCQKESSLPDNPYVYHFSESRGRKTLVESQSRCGGFPSSKNTIHYLYAISARRKVDFVTLADILETEKVALEY